LLDIILYDLGACVIFAAIVLSVAAGLSVAMMMKEAR
jgi:hypothetical protein